MPKCEECEYRFICYTLANTERPRKVRVNWKIVNNCGKCIHAKFPLAHSGYSTITSTVGYCDVAKMIIHKDSAICSEDNYIPKKVANIDKVYNDLKDFLKKKNRKTKLPKYCILEDDDEKDNERN